MEALSSYFDTTVLSWLVAVPFLGALLMLLAPLKRLTGVSATLQRGLAAAETVFEMIDERAEEDIGTAEIGRARGEIEFRNVTFTYTGGGRPALDNISLRIAAGETAEAIKAELLETYGEFVRAAPTAKGFDLAAWLVPPIALALATVAVMLWMRRRGAKVAPVSADAGSVLNAADKARIEAELEKGEKGVRPL